MDHTTIDTNRPGAWGLLVRHGERFSIAGQGIGLEVPLTEAGRLGSRALGESLGHHAWGEVLASPVLRCQQTAAELMRGAGQRDPEGRVKTEPLLSMAYIKDTGLATRAFAVGRPEDVVLAHLRGEPIPGLRTVAEGSELLLDLILAHLAPNALTLFVTHDAVVMPFQRHFCARQHSESEWVGFLDGSLIHLGPDGIVIDGIDQPRDRR